MASQIFQAGVKADNTHPEARETLVNHHTLLSALNKVYEGLLETQRCGARTVAQGHIM